MKHGFTITELLVAIGIFVTLLGISIAGFRSGDYASALRYGSRALEDALRDAQARALSGQTILVCPVPSDAVCPASGVCAGGAPCVARVPSGGYGVNTAPGANAATLFADLDGDARLDTEEKIDSIKFDARGQVAVVGAAGDPGIDIVFLPPRGAMRINADQSVTGFTINLQHSKITQIRSVSVNALSGQISN